jgi:hypothetical protein
MEQFVVVDHLSRRLLAFDTFMRFVCTAQRLQWMYNLCILHSQISSQEVCLSLLDKSIQARLNRCLATDYVDGKSRGIFPIQ